MKVAGLIAAIALAAAPVLATAQNATQDQQLAATPEAGGVSQAGVLPVFTLGALPTGAIVVGSVVILSGVIIGVVAADDSTPATSTTSTN